MKRLVLLAALPFVFISCSPKDPSDPKFVVAKGKDLKITRAELDKETQEKLQQMGLPVAQFPAAQLKMIEPQILEQLINLTLVLNAAEKSGVKDINKKVDEEFAKVTQGMDKAELDKRLAAAHLTEASVKEMMRKKILIQEFLETKIPKEVPVTDEQVAEFYKKNEDKFKEPEMVTAQHIVVLVPKEASPAEKAAKEKIIKDARAKIAKGASFDEVAKQVSEDPSKADGGKLPPFARGDMMPQFEKVAFESKIDALSPVFLTDYGYHILKVNKKTPARDIPLDEIKDKIKIKLTEEEKAKAAQAYVENLRKEANVKILLPTPEAPKNPTDPQVQMVEPPTPGPAPAPAPAPAPQQQ